MECQGRLMIRTQENGEKPQFGPLGPNSGRQKFFFKNLGTSLTRYHDQLSSCTISEKTNDPILRKFSDGRIDRRTRVISKDAFRLTSSVQ